VGLPLSLFLILVCEQTVLVQLLTSLKLLMWPPQARVPLLSRVAMQTMASVLALALVLVLMLMLMLAALVLKMATRLLAYCHRRFCSTREAKLCTKPVARTRFPRPLGLSHERPC
jgi:hypothetical protein